jgi:histidinol-phosphate/aromatic aminotransferase/cobyric acid decarboxylase-like protein
MKIGPSLMKERLEINKKNRDMAFEHIEKVGGAYIPSTSNFFMMSVKGMTGEQFGQAMAAKKILLAGNRWPEWPAHIRVTVGTYEEMGKFNAALDQVVKEGPLKA